MFTRKAQAQAKAYGYEEFKNYLEANYDYISKFDAMLECNRLDRPVSHVEVIQICNELYG